VCPPHGLDSSRPDDRDGGDWFLHRKPFENIICEETCRQKKSRKLQNAQRPIDVDEGIVIFRDRGALLIPLVVSEVDFVKDEVGTNTVFAPGLIVGGQSLDFRVKSGFASGIGRANACECNRGHKQKGDQKSNEGARHDYFEISWLGGCSAHWPSVAQRKRSADDDWIDGEESAFLGSMDTGLKSALFDLS
jgi:hypothetical protein